MNKPHAELTAAAKNLFGADIVDYAYICEGEDATGLGLEKDSISYDAFNIVIVFLNGNAVLFSNSEWAYMEKVTI